MFLEAREIALRLASRNLLEEKEGVGREIERLVSEWKDDFGLRQSHRIDEEIRTFFPFLCLPDSELLQPSF